MHSVRHHLEQISTLTQRVAADLATLPTDHPLHETVAALLEGYTQTMASLQRMLDTSLDLIVTVDRDGRYLSMSDACINILGYRPEEMIGLRLMDFVHPEDRDRTAAAIANVSPGQYTVGFQVRCLHSNGTEVWIEAMGTILPDEGILYAVGRDITQQKSAEHKRALADQALREQEARLRLLVRQVPALLWTTDANLVFTSIQGAVMGGIGVTLDDIIGLSLMAVFKTENRDYPPIAMHRRAFAGESLEFEVELGGRMFASHVEPFCDDTGKIVGVIGVAHDITVRKGLEEQLAYQAFHDALTGLRSRAWFTDCLQHALLSASEAQQVALLFLDLDNFKAVNDSLGHKAGDILLGLVGARIKSCIPSGGTVARIGGDEFTVLLENVTDKAAVSAVAEQIALSLRSPFHLGDREVYTTCSMGVVMATSEHNPADFLRDADAAMYHAKRQGKARCVISEPGMNTFTEERLRLEADLYRAIKRE